jgi:hypothetical protein
MLTAPDGTIRGECSACPESVFSVKIEPYDEVSYESAFRLHLEEVRKGARVDANRDRTIHPSRSGVPGLAMPIITAAVG